MAKAKQGKTLINKTGIIDIIPFVFIIAVIPLIVYLHTYKLDPVETKNWKGSDTYLDLLSYCKSLWFIIASSLVFCFFINKNIRNKFSYKKSIIYIPALVYMLFIIISTIASQYPHIALFGFVARNEGMFVLLFYIVNMLLVYNLITEERQIKVLFSSFIISASILGLIGISQFVGNDFFQTSFGKMLILPREYRLSEINIKFGRMIYATLNNPDYVGSYIALLFPLLLVSFFYIKRPSLKIVIGLLSVLSLVNLYGSNSSAGFVGLAIGIILILIILRKYIFKNIIITIAISMIALTGGGFLAMRMINELGKEFANQSYYLEDIVFEDKSVSIISKTETLTIQYSDSRLTFFDTDNNVLDINVKDNNQSKTITLDNPRYKNYTLIISGNIITIRQSSIEFAIKIGADTLRFIGINGDEPDKMEKPNSVDINGYEKLGSARVYIWARTIPLLRNSIFTGYGPDTFAILFPQNDYIGKINAYGNAGMLVDKPHNMYLQIAVNTGVISLITFLILIGIYILSSIRLFLKKHEHDFISLSGISVFIGICSYLTAGFFNDSVVSVAPVFWILLGIGFACNDLVKKESNG